MKNNNFSEVINKLTFADIELSTSLKTFQSKAVAKFINDNFCNYVFDVQSNDAYLVKIKLSEIRSDISVLIYIKTNLKGRKVCYLQINDFWIERENRYRECFNSMYNSMLAELATSTNITEK